MPLEITLLTQQSNFALPRSLITWVGWAVLVGFLIFLLWKGQRGSKKWSRLQWGLFIGLLLLTLPSNLLLAIRISAGNALPPPGQPMEPVEPMLLIFGAVPWVFAAGLLSPLAAALLGWISGSIQAYWVTSSVFTPLEYSLMATLLAAAANQRYRWFIYRWLRQPLIATGAMGVLYLFLYLTDTTLLVEGSLASRLDYAITNMSTAYPAVMGQLWIAGTFAQIVALLMPRAWGRQGPLQPAPAERKLRNRFLSALAPVVGAAVIILMYSVWQGAIRSAERMLQDRMQSTALISAESVPIFLEAGQNLILQIAQDESWKQDSPDQVASSLERALRTIPYFNQLYLLDAQGNPIAGYPNADFNQVGPAPQELAGVNLALNGVPIQTYPVPPLSDGSSARVSFIASIQDEQGNEHGILIGRTDLTTNPFMQPLLSSFASLESVNGQAFLLDEEQKILYHSQGISPIQSYNGQVPQGVNFFLEVSPDGTRWMVATQPVIGRPWTVVINIPARESQQLALTLAAPLLLIILAISLLSVMVLNLTLGRVTGSLQTLALESERIAGGQLDHPLEVEGVDEVGQLRRAFEQMRVRLKDRLEELNRLLVVSQGVASTLDMAEAVQPILESALASGAASVRVVLSSAVAPEVDSNSTTQTRFGIGPATDLVEELDDQILALMSQQERLVLTNPTRARLINFPVAMQRPEAILAMALRHENLYYGTLWLAYDTPHRFSDDEIRFLSTLSGQAALAAANTRLFLNAEVGRQRLAAILASTPDPVLVTDHRNRLLLSNPAAWQVLGLEVETGRGLPIEKVIHQNDLVRVMRSYSEDALSTEVTLGDEKVYLATASSVLAEGRQVGRVCILRDVTHFKQLDTLKSEFVATVSHDLRSPLTLMRGYATMLEMVGELNEQQTGYVRKIVAGVESMSRLVNNLLDLGRIEAGLDLQLEMVPVRDIVERVTGSMQLQANQKQILLNTDVEPESAPLVEADLALLQQALHNLVENAIKYTPNGGKVEVRIHSDQDQIRFAISDTGIGIAPVDQPRLFEKFYRGAQREAKKQNGSGLGLAIVKSIAERHGGQVWVESQLGKGSTFTLEIPLRQASRDKSAFTA
jgi:PAS domain S-box-containing protein